MRFLAQQYVERDGVEHALLRRLLGHLRPRQRRRRRPGAARARALSEHRRATLPLLPGPQRAGDGARRRRLRPACATGWRRSPCTASVGPGSTNMVTGAALATVNRHPGAAAARRRLRHPGRQPGAAGARGPDAARRQRQRRLQAGLAVLGPDQPARAAARRAARRDARAHRPGRDRRGHPLRCRRTCRPRRTTGRTSCSPSGSGTSAVRPSERGRARPRGRGDPRRASGPLIVAGGGVIYSRGDRRRCAPSPRPPASRSRRPRRARARCAYDHPQAVGARRGDRHDRRQHARQRGRRGASASAPATATSPPPPGPSSPTRTCAFVNLNVASFDAHKLVGDGAASATPAPALEQLAQRARRLDGRRRPTASGRPTLAAGVGRHRAARLRPRPRPAAGAVGGDRRGQRAVAARATSWSAPPARCPATCTSCGAPATRKGYHVEYGFSCMGYEIAGGLGVKMAALTTRARTATCSSWSATART